MKIVNSDMQAVLNLMDDYNLTWAGVYNILNEAIQQAIEDAERLESD